MKIKIRFIRYDNELVIRFEHFIPVTFLQYTWYDVSLTFWVQYSVHPIINNIEMVPMASFASG